MAIDDAIGAAPDEEARQALIARLREALAGG